MAEMKEDKKMLLPVVLSFIFLVVITVEIFSDLGWISGKSEFRRVLFWVVTGEVVVGVISFWDKLTRPSFAKPPDIGDKWAYICEREDGTYAHGGNCKIELKRGDNGWEFTMVGTREWEANEKVGGEWRRTPIVPPDWHSEWGTFTGKTAMHYEYNVQVHGMVIERGHGSASINGYAGKRASLMNGNFLQLSANTCYYGSQKFTRLGS